LVVIHDEDDLLFHHHCDALEYAERVSVARRVSILVARSRPSRASMIERRIARLIPMPYGQSMFDSRASIPMQIG
jgi:hypothetical protein